MRAIITLLILLIFTSCKEEKSIENATISIPNYEELGALDIKLSKPKTDDWLYSHKEFGQTFKQYINKKPIRATEDKKVIYIQPIGTFTVWQKKVIAYNVDYIKLFFGLETKVLPTINEETIPSDKIRLEFHTEQLHAGYIINTILPEIVPDDAIVIMALTAKDLYPEPSWSYVFGLASYTERTGVSSIYRFSEDTLSESNYSLCLNRIIKTSTHEITHMLSVNHCINAVCLMNGVNHIYESDAKPNALCSVCLAKLSWNLKFDDAKRLKLLIAFLKKHKLDSDAVILQNQLNVITK